jgi:hypothetical protein
MTTPRGRRSAAALTLVGVGAGGMQIERIERPAPPASFSDAESDVWRETTSALPADWFRPEQLPLLTQYCRHVVRANVIADKIATVEEALAEIESRPAEQFESPAERSMLWEWSSKNYDRLLKQQERQSSLIIHLATKMRLTQQSTYDKSKRKPTVGARPWDK